MLIKKLEEYKYCPFMHDRKCCRNTNCCDFWIESEKSCIKYELFKDKPLSKYVDWKDYIED